MMASCNGRCVRNRDRGFINPYDVTVGDHVIEPDANCLEHSRPAIPRVDANVGPAGPPADTEHQEDHQ